MLCYLEPTVRIPFSFPPSWVLSCWQLGACELPRAHWLPGGRYGCLLSVPKLYLTPWDPVDYSLPGSSIHGVFLARTLEWVVISSSRRSSQLRGWTLHWQADSLLLSHTRSPRKKYILRKYKNEQSKRELSGKLLCLSICPTCGCVCTFTQRDRLRKDKE